MKPSEECKFHGLKGLGEFSQLSGKSCQTLINWHKNSKFLFDSYLLKALIKKDEEENK